MKKENIFIVLPAYNEWSELLKTIKKIQKEWFKNIVVANDWSKDDTEKNLENAWVFWTSHIINRWAWAATQTWIELALKLWADFIVTMDSDWQHFPTEIHKLVTEIQKENLDAVIWSRFLETNSIPIHRRFFNKIWNLVTWFFFWAFVTDSQSWFKIFSKQALQKLEIESNWFEFCSEIIQKLHVLNLKYKEIPISVAYTAYSQSKWQSFFNWLKTLMKLFLHSLIK